MAQAMATSTPAAAKDQAAREKFRVAGSSLLAATLLVVLKLAVGLWTGSLGILAEAAHSGLDLLAAGITLWAVRMSARPADRKQTYGYGKFENLSALFEMLLLLLTCAWIVYEAGHRLLFSHKHVEINLWAFLVVLLSIAVDYWRSRALWRDSQKYHSRALEADALHFSTDIWSSGVVLLGLAGVAAARHWSLDWLRQADTLAALGVAAIVVAVSLQLGKKSVDDLLDRIPDDLRDQVIQAASRVPGVERVTQVRLRRAGSEVFADVTLAVGRAVTFEQAHQIADRAAEAVRSVVAEADVVVHPEPAAEDALDLTTKVRMLAARHGLEAHAVRFYEEHGRRWLELHLEVQESLSLEEAHRQRHGLRARRAGRVAGTDAGRLAPGAGGRRHGPRPGRAGRRVAGPRRRRGVLPRPPDFHRQPAQPQGAAGRRRANGLLPLPVGGRHGHRRRARVHRPGRGVPPPPHSRPGPRGDPRRAAAAIE